MRKLTRRSVFGLGLPLWLGGCGSDDKAPADGDGPQTAVELFSWWIAPGEADALDALFKLYTTTYPGEEIFNAAIESGPRAREILAARLEAGTPPDLYQENAYNLAAVMAKNPGSVTPLTELFEELGLMEAVVPEVIENVTIDGEIYSMPVNIHRENAVHYNKKVFEDLGLEIPKTLEELLATCETIKAAGIVPLATCFEGWVQRILFQALMSAKLGADAYRDYLLAKTKPADVDLAPTITLLDEILTSYVNESAGDAEFGWTDAADLVLEGKAAMFIHGDWAKGYYTQLGWEPGEGFGVFGMPGATELFQYGVDILALVKGSPHEADAMDFLRTVASEAGQIAFNAIKGSSPIRLDTDETKLDPVAKATLQDLRNAEIRMMSRTREEWDAALGEFATDRDHDKLLQVFAEFPPLA
jgi:glucose/mannose transport system substrate-binding protein